MERILKFTELTLKHGKSQKGPWTMALFTGDDSQVYQTFDAGLRNQGEAAVQAGSQVSIVYEQETRNNFTNNVLKSIEIVSEATGSRSNGTEPVEQLKVPAFDNSANLGSSPSTRDEQIWRQTATKVAARLLALEADEDQHPENFYALVQQLLDFYKTGEVPIPF